eukprot:m.26400 g.26400  ORF g.26400 m.26400 type:complete len:90 (+) comp11741_c0_seq1:115-384(+)
MSKSVFSGKGTFTGMLKQHPEILPVVAAVGVACVGAVFYMGRLCTRPDVVWSGRQDMPWTRVSQKTNLHVWRSSRPTPCTTAAWSTCYV